MVDCTYGYEDVIFLTNFVCLLVTVVIKEVFLVVSCVMAENVA